MIPRWITILAIPVVFSIVMIGIIELGYRVFTGGPYEPVGNPESIGLIPFFGGSEVTPSSTPSARVSPTPVSGTGTPAPTSSRSVSSEREVQSAQQGSTKGGLNGNNDQGNDILDARDKRIFIGQTILMTGIVVKKIDTPRVFWVGELNSGSDIIIFVSEPIAEDKLVVGDQVRVKGEVTALNQDVVSDWRLSSEQRTTALRQSIYIRALGIGKIVSL